MHHKIHSTHNFVIELYTVRHTTDTTLLMTVHIKYRYIIEYLIDD